MDNAAVAQAVGNPADVQAVHNAAVAQAVGNPADVQAVDNAAVAQAVNGGVLTSYTHVGLCADFD